MPELRDLVERYNGQLARALATGMHEPTAAALATVSADHRPSVRMVLVKGADERGFVFYTNLGSRKSRELEHSPHAALCVWWGSLKEQVRVEGRVEPVSEKEADAYFATRPRASQIAAWASKQTEPLASRAALIAEFERLTRVYDGRDVPRPPFWSGFRLLPDRVEFWYGRPDRLHERFEYTLEGGRWEERILSP